VLLRITPTDAPRGFRVEGELDLATEGELRRALEAATAEGGELALDLSGLTFIDSSGLRVLIQTAASLDGRGALVVLRPSSPVKRVFDIAIPGGFPGLDVRD